MTHPPEPDVRLEWVPTDALVIDHSYQRRISRKGETTIKKITDGFSWRQFGALTVEETDGKLAVIDGQHRAAAARQLGIAMLPAVVAPPADTATAAQTFMGVNATRTNLASIDKFRALVASGDPDAVVVADILTELDISTDVTVGHALGPKQTRATSRLSTLVKKYGRGTVFTALEAMVDAQPDEPNLLIADSIEATVRMVDATIAQDGDLDHLVAALSEIDFDTARDSARIVSKNIGGKLAALIADRIASVYNKGRRKRVDL